MLAAAHAPARQQTAHAEQSQNRRLGNHERILKIHRPKLIASSDVIGITPPSYSTADCAVIAAGISDFRAKIVQPTHWGDDRIPVRIHLPIGGGIGERKPANLLTNQYVGSPSLESNGR